MKTALITGITGQDGSFLAELLLEKGYEVHGIVRRAAVENQTVRMSRIAHLTDRITLHTGSLESYPSIFKIVHEVQPDECYHLAAQSFVKGSFDDEFTTTNTNINGAHNVLSSIKENVPDCKFYFAASSEMFGKVEETPQTETTKFHPRSVYGVSKVAGYELTRYYREAYNMFACSGILFNHESERRGFEFVTRKITDGVAKIYRGLSNELVLGNLDAKRDWGYAPEYVNGMWLMMQQSTPDDYILATGKTYSIHEFVIHAFIIAGLDWKEFVKQDARFMRPAEVDYLVGDYSKAKRILGWQPNTEFTKLVELMVKHDINRLSKH